MSSSQHDAQLRWAAKQALLRQQQLRRFSEPNEDGLILPRATPSPEHYHIVYNVPKENLSIPHMTKLYVSSRDAYQAIYDLGQQAEPNTEYYDETGQIGIETRLHGRADLWWIVLEVAACIRSSCTKPLEKMQQKRRLILLPEDD